MAIKNLPFTKCTKCGKTTLTDEYFLTGCSACGDKIHGVDNHAFKRRVQLAVMEGTNVFIGKFRKVGNVHYRQSQSFVLVENIRCGTDSIVTSHAYITDVSPNTLELLRSTEPGTSIQFKARVHQYDRTNKKYGFDHMHHVTMVA